MGALRAHFTPEQCTYTIPTGGMFFWLTFPTLKRTSTHELFVALAAADVIVVPGTGFRVAGMQELLDQGVVPVSLEQRALGLDGYTAAAGGDVVGGGDGGAGVARSAEAESGDNGRSPCVRACYAAVGAEKIVEAIKAMALCITELERKEKSAN